MGDYWREILVGGKKYVTCNVFQKEMCLGVWHQGLVVPSGGFPARHHQSRFTRDHMLSRSRHANFPILLVLGCASSVHWNYFGDSRKWPYRCQILAYLQAFFPVFQIATWTLILVFHKHLNINMPQTALIILPLIWAPHPEFPISDSIVITTYPVDEARKHPRILFLPFPS